MLAVQCPSCAAPVPVSLAAVEVLTCGRCGHQGPIPPDAAARLAEGARWLTGLDRRAVQLTSALRRSLTSSWLWVALHVGFSSVLAAPLVLTGATILVVTLVWGGRVSTFLIAVSLAPLLAAALVGAVGLRSIRVRRRALQLACVAVPPAVAGEPARCHVCAAPLSAGANIVRCAHCEADNLVEPGVLARLHGQRSGHLDDLQARLDREVTSVGQASAVATAGTILAAVTAPLLAVATAIVTAAILRVAELPADDTLRYAVRDGCLVPGGDLAVTDLIGLRVSDRFAFDTPQVDKVYVDPIMDENYLRANDPNGRKRLPVVGTCLAGPAWGRTLAKAPTPRWVHIDGAHVWYLAGNAERGLWKVPLEGGAPERQDADSTLLDAAVWDGNHWTAPGSDEVEANEHGVFRITRGAVEGPHGTLATPTGAAVALTVAGTDLFWFDRDGFAAGAEWGLADLKTVPTGGGAVRTLATRILIPDNPEISVTRRHVLWIARDNSVLQIPREGGPTSILRPAGYAIDHLQVDGSWTAWTSGAGLTVLTTPGDAMLVQPQASRAGDFDVDARWLVIADEGIGRIVAVERAAISFRPAP